MLSLLFRPVLIVFVAAYAYADTKDLETIFRTELSHKVVLLRGFYKGDFLKYDPAGQPEFKTESGPWTLYGQIEVSNIKVNQDKLRIEGNRIFVAWPQDDSGAGHMKQLRSPDRVRIEVTLDSNHQDEHTIRQLLDRVFVNSRDNLAQLVPEHWRQFLARDATRIQDVGSMQTIKNAARAESSGEPNAMPIAKGARSIRINQGISETNILKKVQPEYPPLAKAARLDGDLLFTVVIDKEGALRDISVAKPLGLGMEESALQAVKQWKYRPYTVNGQPIEVETLITVRYTLK
jgi:TonB family protein